METTESLYFAEPLEPARPKFAANAPAPAVTKAAPVITPVATLDSGEDLFVETAGELPAVADGFAPAPLEAKLVKPKPAPAMAPAAIAARKFEPIEVADELYVGVAYELNRRNDGIIDPCVPVARSKPPSKKPTPPAPELSRAVKLTGEAVYAWVSVLTGPALVTVTK